MLVARHDDDDDDSFNVKNSSFSNNSVLHKYAIKFYLTVIRDTPRFLNSGDLRGRCITTLFS